MFVNGVADLLQCVQQVAAHNDGSRQTDWIQSGFAAGVAHPVSSREPGLAAGGNLAIHADHADATFRRLVKVCRPSVVEISAHAAVNEPGILHVLKRLKSVSKRPSWFESIR